MSKILTEEYLSLEQLAELVQKSPRTVRNWATRRVGPPPTRVLGKVLYRAEAVRTWLKGLEREHRPLLP